MTAKINEVLTYIKSETDFTPDEIRSQEKSKWLTLVRHLTWKLIQDQTGLNHTAIARMANRCDHSAITYGIASINELLAVETNDKMTTEIQRIYNNFKSIL